MLNRLYQSAGGQIETDNLIMKGTTKPAVTAVVIAKNEEPRITECLKRLAWTDERIVIDNGSTDRTITLAKRQRARVVRIKERNFSLLRNRGKREAHSSWILYVDADEWVTDDLQEEILKTVSNYKPGAPIAYYIQRKNYYLGALWPTKDKMQRLFLKSALCGWKGIVHETAEVVGETGVLKEPLVHRTHRTLEEMVAKTNEWSQMEAELRFASGHPPVVWWRLIRVIMTGFYRSFIGEDGWKAGTIGWIESIYQAFSMFITYAKLWELQKARGKTIEG